jgi:hypothetical protein
MLAIGFGRNKKAFPGALYPFRQPLGATISIPTTIPQHCPRKIASVWRQLLLPVALTRDFCYPRGVVAS